MILTCTMVNPAMRQIAKTAAGRDVKFHKPEHLMEWAARSCYHSERNFQAAPSFMAGIVKSQHYDILEHGYLAVDLHLARQDDLLTKYYWAYTFKKQFPYAQIDVLSEGVQIGGNMRVWHEIYSDDFAYIDGFVLPFALQHLKNTLGYLAPTLFGEPTMDEDEYEMLMNELLDVQLTVYFPPSVVTAQGNEITLIAYAPPVGEFGYYSYGLGKVSRALMAQHTRHRTMVHSVKSFRYCEPYEEDYVHFIDETPEQHELIEAYFAQSLALYETLHQGGLSKQHARGVLLSNISTDIITSGPTKAWMHYFHERTASDAQAEIRSCAMMMEDMFNV